MPGRSAHGVGAAGCASRSLLYPRLVAWHRYRRRARSGRVDCCAFITHGKHRQLAASTTALARMQVGRTAAIPARHHAARRPVAATIQTRVSTATCGWSSCSRQVHYDDAEAQRNAPMLVGDVFSSAIFAAANRALSQLGDWLGIAPDLGELDDWTRRFATAVQRQWDPRDELALDLDVRSGKPIHVQTYAGCRRCWCPGWTLGCWKTGRHAARAELCWCGWLQVPRDLKHDARVRRGSAVEATGAGRLVSDELAVLVGAPPARPRAGRRRAAQSNLDLLRAPTSRFAEYLEPYTGEPLGSMDQSWTAAVALDWLSLSPL